MRTIVRAALVAVLAFAVVGCAQVQQTWEAITSANVSPTFVLVAANSFDGLEATATNYLRLPRCPTATICRSPAATAAIIPAVRSGRIARNTLEQFMTAHPGRLGDKGAYDALIAANSALQGVFSQYGVGQ